MTYPQSEIDEAQRRIQQLGRAWIAEGKPAGAFREALTRVPGFGLHTARDDMTRPGDTIHET